jgi:predicted NBD/HSP70 family sugar kinase
VNFPGGATANQANPRHRKATKHDSRRSNLRTTLDLVSLHGSTSRAELSRITGLTRAAMSSLVSELIDQGLLRELGPGTSAGGKPPTLVALNPRGRDIVALDLGRRPFQGALVDLGGHIHHRLETAHRDLKGEAAVAATLQLVEDLTGLAEAPVLGVGIATPGVVDVGGMVLEAANLDWHHLDLGGALALPYPVSIANDAQVATLAEARRRPQATDSLLLVKLGRGVGAGVFLGAGLHRGEHASAGEIGHVRVVEDGIACSCGNRGCLETVASVPAILRSLEVDPDLQPWDGIALAAMVGDEPLRRSLRAAGRYLGGVLAHAVGLLDVGRIVIASELRNAGEDLIDEVRRELAERILPSNADTVSVELSSLGGDLVLSGAATLVLSDRLGVMLH